MAEPSGELHEITREIGSTPQEYVRALGLAFPGGLTGGPTAFRARSGEVVLAVELRPGAERRIALLRLPSLHVRIRFLSGDQAARRRVLRHMDLAMQRGGG